MNDRERELIRHVCDGDIRKAQAAAQIVLEGLTTKKDEQFKRYMLRRLEAKGNFIELPANLRELLVAEDVTNFPESRFLLREREREAAEKTLALYRVADKLADKGISFLPALMLYGASGCGKTMLARYIAHKANLPFIYVKFSGLVSSYLGSTQTNIGRIFDYARNAPCVLCFDEIDAVGMARGQRNDVGEMNRIVISLMQEMDRTPNGVIIIGTTNRFDRLDEALIRRFPLQYELFRLSADEAHQLAKRFFRYSDMDYTDEWIEKWCKENLGDNISGNDVVKKCTDWIVQDLIRENMGS